MALSFIGVMTTCFTFFSLSATLNSGNSSTACFRRLSDLQKDFKIHAAAAAWIMAVGGAGGIATDDLSQIILGLSADNSSTVGLPLFVDFEGQLAHCMSTSMLCGGPDAVADTTLANR